MTLTRRPEGPTYSRVTDQSTARHTPAVCPSPSVPVTSSLGAVVLRVLRAGPDEGACRFRVPSVVQWATGGCRHADRDRSRYISGRTGHLSGPALPASLTIGQADRSLPAGPPSSVSLSVVYLPWCTLVVYPPWCTLLGVPWCTYPGVPSLVYSGVHTLGIPTLGIPP